MAGDLSLAVIGSGDFLPIYYDEAAMNGARKICGGEKVLTGARGREIQDGRSTGCKRDGYDSDGQASDDAAL